MKENIVEFKLEIDILYIEIDSLEGQIEIFS